MKQIFSLNSDQIRVREILNKNFVEIEIWAISNIDPNLNESTFSTDSLYKGAKTFIDKPILGFFNKDEDFEQHNGYVEYDSELEQHYWENLGGEQILGFVRESDQVEVVERDGLMWIRCTAMVYTQYNYRQIKRLLKDKRKKVSVEIDVLESEQKGRITYIYDFNLLGITILGSKGGVPIKEAIPGAHLSVLDLLEPDVYRSQKQALVFAYNQLNNQEGNTLGKDDVGTKGALKVNKSKEAMSDTDWGEVDKTALRNRVVAASNFKSVAKDVFLDLREGWEDGETSKLKYPVMQLKGDDEVVYNRGGLASARGYAEKNNEEAVLKKLEAIYRELDLDEEDKYNCEQFCELYEDEKDDHEEDDHKDEDENKDKDESKDDSGEEKEDPKCHSVETESDLQKQCEELKMKCEEYECRCAEYEKKCSEYECHCNEQMKELEKYQDYEDMKKELEALRSEKEERCKCEQKSYVDLLCEKMKLSAEEKGILMSKCEDRKYASKEDIERDVAFICFEKQMKDKNVSTNEQFATNIVETLPPETSNKVHKKQTVMERLQNNIEKK